MPENNNTQQKYERITNRELSWIDFNERVLQEALREDIPLLERLRFLCIADSNLDEFFMIRMAALKRLITKEKTNALTLFNSYSELEDNLSDTRSPKDIFNMCGKKIRNLIQIQYQCLNNDLLPLLAKNGLEYAPSGSWTDLETAFLQIFFFDDIFPLLTPLRFDDFSFPPVGHSLYAAFLLDQEEREQNTGTDHKPFISIMQIPRTLNRIIIFPENSNEKTRWTLIDNIITFFSGSFFHGFYIKEKMLFKINRDADFSVDEKRDEDFIEAMEEVVSNRETSSVVRMVYSKGRTQLKDKIAAAFNLFHDDLYEVDEPLDLRSLLELTEINGFDHLKVKSRNIYPHPAFDDFVTNNKTIWDRIKENDICIHLPYQSFDPVVRFFSEAAADPDVVAIKSTLYRTSWDSPIVKSLEQAALHGKQVTVIVELKARFDEERNILWAKGLEKSGVIVIYGLARLKVHAKMALVARREGSRMRRYVHLSTGNYNDKTAKLYSDLSIFTATEDFAYDAGLLFNMITGYSAVNRTRQIVAAPFNLKNKLLHLIDREAKKSTLEHPGIIKAKLNAIVDTDIISALYRASSAGVKIFLNIRGICCLVPGVPHFSENIYVISIIDHFLEHSRIIYFANGGSDELYLSSADWMQRNLERRVEIMFPVLDEKIKDQIYGILSEYFNDNCQAHTLESSGNWRHIKPSPDKITFRAQEYFSKCAEKLSLESKIGKKEIIVRRS